MLDAAASEIIISQNTNNFLIVPPALFNPKFSVGFGPPRRHELPKLEVGRWKGTSVKNVACRDPVSLVYPSWQTGNYAEAGTLPEPKAATVY